MAPAFRNVIRYAKNVANVKMQIATMDRVSAVPNVMSFHAFAVLNVTSIPVNVFTYVANFAPVVDNAIFVSTVFVVLNATSGLVFALRRYLNAGLIHVTTTGIVRYAACATIIVYAVFLMDV